MNLRTTFAALPLFFLATSASAGDRTPLSSLPAMPATRDRLEAPEKTGVAGLAYVEHQLYASVEAQKQLGYCIVSREFGFQFQSTMSLDETPREVWRWTEADGKLTIEVTRYSANVASKSVWVRSRASVTPREIGSYGAYKVWAFRESNGDVVVLAQGAESGREAVPPSKPDDGEMFHPASSDCSFGAARISAGLVKTGAVARLRTSQGSFVVDVSAAKLSRDPEPVLTVRVRHAD